MKRELPPSFDDDNIRINILSIKNEIPEDDIEKYCRARVVSDYDTMIAIQNKYPAANSDSKERTDEENDVQELNRDTNGDKDQAQKASNTYKKLTRVLRYQLLREEVLLTHEHKCFCCGVQFPTRSEFDKEFPGEKYPLLSRCNFPIVKYIEIHNLHNIPDLLKDTKVFDVKNYLPICGDCKPMSFDRHK